MANTDESTPSPEQKAQKPLLPIFVHSRVDEYGLTAAQFRLYAHIARRGDNKTGDCFASIASMADVCKLHPTTIRRSLADLAKFGLVSRLERRGYTTIHRIVALSQWPPSPMPDKHPTQPDTPVSHVTPSQTDAPVCNVKDVELEAAHASQTKPDPSSATKPDEGNPTQDDPKKIIHTLAGARAERVKLDSAPPSLSKQVEAVYSCYPRKARAHAARKAIRRALIKVTFEQLLQATTQFAKAWENALPEQMRYCPYASRWFNEEGFLDEVSSFGPALPARPSVGSINAEIKNLSTLIEKHEMVIDDYRTQCELSDAEHADMKSRQAQLRTLRKTLERRRQHLAAESEERANAHT